MQRRQFLSTLTAATVVSTIPTAAADNTEKTNRAESTALTGDRFNPITEADIEEANKEILDKVRKSSSIAQDNDTPAIMPKPVNDDSKVTVGYYVSINEQGRVRYYNGRVPDVTEEFRITQSQSDHEKTKAVSKIHETVNSLNEGKKQIRPQDSDCYNPDGLFDDGNEEEWIDEWGCPDVEGRSVTRGETDDEFDYIQENKSEGILKVDETLFMTKDDDWNQVVSTLSKYRCLPGEAIDSRGYDDWKLNKLEPTHNYAANTDNTVVRLEGKPDDTKEAPSGINGFSIGAGIESVSIGLSWTHAPNKMDKILSDYNGESTTSVRWEHEWDATQATPTTYAASAAKFEDTFWEDDQVFRSEADMRVVDPGFFWDDHSNVLTTVEYYKDNW